MEEVVYATGREKRKERRTEMKTMREITDRTVWTHRLRLAIVVLFVTGAVAQTHYSVQDLGALKGGNFACAMGLNDKGWTEVMDTLLNEKSGNIRGRASQSR